MNIELIVAVIGLIHLILTSATLLLVRDVRNNIRIAITEERDRMKTWVHQHYVPREVYEQHLIMEIDSEG